LPASAESPGKGCFQQLPGVHTKHYACCFVYMRNGKVLLQLNHCGHRISSEQCDLQQPEQQQKPQWRNVVMPSAPAEHLQSTSAVKDHAAADSSMMTQHRTVHKQAPVTVKGVKPGESPEGPAHYQRQHCYAAAAGIDHRR
jgi:hypothetical protein